MALLESGAMSRAALVGNMCACISISGCGKMYVCVNMSSSLRIENTSVLVFIKEFRKGK